MTTRRLLFLLLLFLLLCNACKPEPYKKYVPEDSSPFKITFEYPSGWEFFTNDSDDYLYYHEPPSFFSFISSFPSWKEEWEFSFHYGLDPRVGNFQNSFFIDVWVDDPDGKYTAYNLLLDTLNALRSLPERQHEVTILEDHQIQIGGIPAIELVLRKPSYKSQIFDKISRIIFLPDGDRYYFIKIVTFENDPDQTFLQEVDRLIESIEKIP